MIPEGDIHYAVADYLHLVLAPNVLWTTIGHGGGGKARGGQLKGAGLRAGVGDILICWWDSRQDTPCVMWIELKSEKGKQSPEQSAFAHDAEAVGHIYYICRSVADVQLALTARAVPVRGKIAA